LFDQVQFLLFPQRVCLQIIPEGTFDKHLGEGGREGGKGGEKMRWEEGMDGGREGRTERGRGKG